MVIIDFSHEPGSQMIKMSIFIAKVGLDKFGGCHFLQFT